MEDLKTLVDRFLTTGETHSVVPFGSGHINDSYRATPLAGGSEGYVLQRINHRIFTDVPALMQNMLAITTHVRKRLTRGDQGSFTLPELIEARQGGYFVRDRDGGFWRLMSFIPGGRSFDRIASREMAREAGQAFATFQYLASDIGPGILTEILPGFHDLRKRLGSFRDTIARDPVRRVGGTGPEIAFVRQQADAMLHLQHLIEQGLLPVRVTHNDTKINNVLFDDTDHAFAVVDLDTVMPGTILFDFGDAIRTGAASAPEDEADLSRMHIDLSLFESYAQGYLGVAGRFLTPVERENLAFSAQVMTFIIGLRFLTDHLDGDRYYKTAFPGHNLQRAKAQFRLVVSMEENDQAMREIIARIG